MFILVVAYLGGILTILSPCVLPVLPFVFARADRPFRTHGLPLLLGLALAFAATATLAAVGGSWVVSLNHYGRGAAIGLMALFGAALLFPAWADRLSQPLVRLGNRLSETASVPASSRYAFLAPLLLGVGTGMLWTPCAGPILGLILTTAALRGANLGTSVLLLAYAAGAATSLAGALLFGGRLFSMLRGTLRTGENIRRVAGLAVLAGAGAIALGLDTGVLSQIPFGSTTRLEQSLVEKIESRPARLTEPSSSTRPSRPGLMLTAAGASDAMQAQRLPVQGNFPSLAGATEWINSAPLSAESLRGKVVLVDFWTYSCINCLRTLPYLKAWSQKYKDAGLVVVGVHTPEFAFEKKPSNVQAAVKDLGIGFPVALDSNFSIWRAFGNRAWPAFYFIDAQGRIRHQQLGEGRYDKAESVIQQLLAEAGQGHLPAGLVVDPVGQGTQAAAGPTRAQSGETYIGYAQADNFASPGGLVRDRAHRYETAAQLRPDEWSLAGDWTVDGERAVLDRANGRISYRFQARDLHLVLGPAKDGSPVRFRVRVDGKAPQADHGFDVDAEGNGTIDRQRLYQLVRQARDGNKPRLFEIEFLDPGVQDYAFTFG
ncbi:cytochrome c biogenesis protein DipZ [Variovorax sp. OV329]|uniref:cytochrome c biogenesis protein DipZ n=1 Tax=Variovorax sp. OV329 TaxID=1882825 RepID=UPI0008EC49A3|nr:cytochrome c biogenesis protein DipZ [Variovorax sp. OV329]SFN02933.1 Cytochrome c biogenesis protein CcdA [Variovorax sp. OV329]